MNTQSPYPDVEIPEMPLPRFVLDRADERGAAVPLMGPVGHGSASPLMGPATAGTITPLMGPAGATPLLGPADRSTMVPLMGPRRPGRSHAADAPKPVTPRADRSTDVSPGPAAVRQAGLYDEHRAALIQSGAPPDQPLNRGSTGGQ